MKIITIWNLKGGTGKTTTTFNLAANLAKDNKMLLLDLDMQANLTSFFDIDTKKYKTNKPDISALLADDSINVSKSIYHSRIDNIDYIKGSNDVMKLHLEDISVLGSRLSELSTEYDICIIDCHPDASVISENALAIADLVLIPINLDGFSRDNLNLVIKEIIHLESQCGEINYKIFVNKLKNLRSFYPGFVVRKYSSLEECFKEKEGRSHSGHAEYKLNYECSLRGIKINNRKEITWHEFVSAATEMGLYNPDNVYNKPSDKEIKLAYNSLTANANIKKYSSAKLLENHMKETYRYRQCLSSTISYDCTYRGIAINNKEEITWHEFVISAIRMDLYTFECNDNDVEADEQIPGQDDIYHHPEFLPEDIKSYSNEDNMQKIDNENVTDSVTNPDIKAENLVLNITESQRVADVQRIGNCPFCNAPLIFISNRKYCGSCGKAILWNERGNYDGI